MNLDLQHPHGAGELLATTFAFFRAHATALFTMTLIVVAPAVIAIDGVWARGLADGPNATAPRAATLTQLAVQALVEAPLVGALNAVSVIAAARGDAVGVGAAWRAALPRVAPAIATVTLAALGIVLGFAALIVPGIWLAVRWYVAVQASVIEARGPADALRRCGALVKGEWWPTFGCLILAGLTFGLLALVGQAIGAATGNGVLYVSILAITQAAAASMAAIFAALLFFDLRARKEGRPA